MTEPGKNPFDILVEQFRVVVREEIQSALNGNGHASLMTAEHLAKALQVNKATVYEWVKSKSIPFYQAGRFVRFNLAEVLEAQEEKHPLTFALY